MELCGPRLRSSVRAHEAAEPLELRSRAPKLESPPKVERWPLGARQLGREPCCCSRSSVGRPRAARIQRRAACWRLRAGWPPAPAAGHGAGAAADDDDDEDDDDNDDDDDERDGDDNHHHEDERDDGDDELQDVKIST